MPYRTNSAIGHMILFLRWPVLTLLVVSTTLQFLAAFNAAFTPGQLNLPDIIPPLNTAILAVLWWRLSQLEKLSDYFRERIDKVSDHQDTQDRDTGHRLRRDKRDERERD